MAQARATESKDGAAQLVNIAPLATVTSVPYCGTLDYLTDGVVPTSTGEGIDESGAIHEYSVSGSGGTIDTFAVFPYRTARPTITFTFDLPAEVVGVRFHQFGSFASSYLLEIDPDGSGHFVTLADRADTARANAWESVDLPSPRRFQSLRFTATKLEGRQAPLITEFEILAATGEQQRLLAKRPAASSSKVPVLSFSAPAQQAFVRPPPDQRYQLGAVGTLWMYTNCWKPYSGIRPGAIRAMKELTLDRARLFVSFTSQDPSLLVFPEAGQYGKYPTADDEKPWNVVPWPSQVFIGYKQNVLKLFALDMEAHGFGLGAIPPRNVPPFDTRSGRYPMQQADHDGKADPLWPCATNGPLYVPALSQALTELADAGLTSVDVTPDEFYMAIHNLKNIPPDDPCRALFHERYGLEVPKEEADTEAYRKWILFQYESTADAFARCNRAAKQANPRIVTETNLSLAPPLFFNSPSFGLALDIVGQRSGVDVLGTDPYYRTDTGGHWQIPRFALMYQGATPTGSTSMMLQAASSGFTPLTEQIWATGAGTSMLMHEVHAIDLYRLDYYADIRDTPKDMPAFRFYKAWTQMVRRLEAEGLKQARKPDSVALLYSRAGEDWWELREKMQAGGPRTYPTSALAGHVDQLVVMDLLMRHGQPYRLFYLDQPQSLKPIANYKLIVVPFAYSLSKEAAQALEQARAGGARVLVLGPHLGPTDEFGTAHERPLLADWVNHPGVTWLNVDLLGEGTQPQVQADIRREVDRLLGDDRPWKVNTAGTDVEAGLLLGQDGKQFLFAINWSRRTTHVDFGLTLPAGRYQIVRHGPEGVSEATIGGEREFTAQSLKACRLDLDAEQTAVLVVKPVSAPGGAQ